MKTQKDEELNSSMKKSIKREEEEEEEKNCSDFDGSTSRDHTAINNSVVAPQKEPLEQRSLLSSSAHKFSVSTRKLSGIFKRNKNTPTLLSSPSSRLLGIRRGQSFGAPKKQENSKASPTEKRRWSCVDQTHQTADTDSSDESSCSNKLDSKEEFQINKNNKDNNNKKNFKDTGIPTSITTLNRKKKSNVEERKSYSLAMSPASAPPRRRRSPSIAKPRRGAATTGNVPGMTQLNYPCPARARGQSNRSVGSSTTSFSGNRSLAATTRADSHRRHHHGEDDYGENDVHSIDERSVDPLFEEISFHQQQDRDIEEEEEKEEEQQEQQEQQEQENSSVWRQRHEDYDNSLFSSFRMTFSNQKQGQRRMWIVIGGMIVGLSIGLGVGFGLPQQFLASSQHSEQSSFCPVDFGALCLEEKVPRGATSAKTFDIPECARQDFERLERQFKQQEQEESTTTTTTTATISRRSCKDASSLALFSLAVLISQKRQQEQQESAGGNIVPQNENDKDLPSIYNDFYGLAVLYFSTLGSKNWRIKDNWLVHRDVCQWHGVTCSPPLNNRVTGLDLSRNNLDGSIPTEIGLLTELTALGLDLNVRLRGTIPSEIGSLKELVVFSTNVVQLQGQIPTEIGNLRSLKKLVIVSEPLESTIPSEIGNLHKTLKTLNIVATPNWGRLPTELQFLTNLESLHLSGNNISGKLSPIFEKLTSLQRLVVETSHAELNLSSLLNITDLLNLRLRSKSIASIPPAISKLTSLNFMQFDGNDFTGIIPTEMGLLTNLEYFHVSKQNKMGGPIPSQFGLLTKLKSFSIEETGVNGKIPSELGLLKGLELFQLVGNKLSGSLPLEMCHLKLIQTFDMEFCSKRQGITPGCIHSNC